MLLELTIAVAHLSVNSIAVVEVFLHLNTYRLEASCRFEPSRTAFAFIFSLIGLYGDACANVLATQHHFDARFKVLLLLFMVQSFLSLAVSFPCWVWGRRVNNGSCETEMKMTPVINGIAPAGSLLKMR